MSTTGALLQVTQPLDLATTLNSGQAFRWRPEPNGAWSGLLGSNLVLLSKTNGGLLVDSAPLPPSQVAAQVLGYLRMDDDLPVIQRRLSADPHVAGAIAAYPGLRLLRQDPWEALAAFILSSTNNMKRIALIIERLAAALGNPVAMEGITRDTFPGPERVAAAGEQALRQLGCGFRAPYLAAAAQTVASGVLPLDRLRGQPYEELLPRLTALHGVGDKIADCAMLFSLDRLDAFPVDRWVQRAVEQWYGTGPVKRYADARDWARQRFGADAGYANQYLFWRRRQTRGDVLTPGLTESP